MDFRQRDIVLINFPFTDLSATKLRPAIILSSDNVNRKGDFICVQITSQVWTDESFFTLTPEMLETSLALNSGVRAHKIFCLHEKLILHKVSAMKPVAFLQLLNFINKVVFAIG